MDRIMDPFSDWPVSYYIASKIFVPLISPTNRYLSTGYIPSCIDDDDDESYFIHFTDERIIGLTLVLRKVRD